MILFKKILLVILGHFIIIVPSVAQQELSGKIIDDKTSEPVVGAQIIIEKRGSGTVTDLSGNYEISIPQGIDEIKIQHLGYQTKIVKVTGSYMVIKLIESVNTLEQVIVSANRLEQQRLEIPAAIGVLDEQQIQWTKATQINQLINQMTGVYMSDLLNESHTMSIRSPLSYRALFLYTQDGIPLRPTGDFSHTTLKEMDQASFKKIEVLRGPNSAIYGSEAIGGVINAITFNPSLQPMVKVSIQRNNIGYRRMEMNLSNTFKNTGVFFGGHFGQMRDGWRDHSDMDKFGGTFKLTHKLSKKTQLMLTSNFIYLNSDRTGNLDSANFFSKDVTSLQTFTYALTKAFRTNINLTHLWSDKSHLTANIFYRNLDDEGIPHYRIRDDRNDPLKARGEKTESGFQSFGTVLQQVMNYKWLGSRWLIGGGADYSPARSYKRRLEIAKDEAGRYVSYVDNGEIFEDYDVDYINLYAYSQYEFAPVNNLRISGAIRYDYFNYKYSSTEDLTLLAGITNEISEFDKVTPKIGATYNFSNNRGVYANTSIGFVPPQISDVYGADLVNRAIEPQVFYNYEVGGWLSILENKLYTDISFYSLNGTNELVLVVMDDGSEQNQNVGETTHKGVEFSANYSPFEDLVLRVNGSYAEHKYKQFDTGEDSYNGNYMERAPKWIANSAVIYKPGFVPGFHIGLELQHLGKYYQSPSNDPQQTYPGFDLLHMRTSYTFSNKLKGLEVWMNILNLTDSHYAEISDVSRGSKRYRPGNPRNFNFGIQYSFGQGEAKASLK